MSHTDESISDTDERLAEILNRLIQDSQSGDLPDLEAVVRSHPDLAEEIRELWATAMIAEDFAGGSDDDSLSGERTAEAASTIPRIFGDYEILDEIGRGGMGIVFKAKQKSLNRIVALKMLVRGEFASEADLARFQAEAEAAGRLDHPHIVPVYEVGEHQGQPYFSMKYVEGTNLARRLVEGPLPAREAALILAPVCRAIEEAHRHNLLHRDLKPSNILIDRQGRPYVTDFGLAKRLHPDLNPASDEGDPTAVNAITESGDILGTPGYMAPEQAAGHRGVVGSAADIYGLGAILYAMLTGRAPFQGASPVETVLMVLEQDPLPPRVLNSHADVDLEMVTLKCLQKPFDLRYIDAGSLARDLEAFLSSEPISARSSRFRQVVSRYFRETHHAGVLENWGLLWMWHSLVLLVLCIITNSFQWIGWTSRWPYLLLWSSGLTVWAGFFWNFRRRSGPITFVERQIAHVWAGSVVGSTLLYAIEGLLGLGVLELSPVLGVISGMVFLAKAGILNGRFYIQAIVLFTTSLVMAALQVTDGPPLGVTLFGVVSAACFFIPGWKYHRQRLLADRAE